MSDQSTPSAPKPIATWRKVVAGILDFFTVLIVGGYVIAKLTGEMTSNGFDLTGVPALILFGLIAAYFYLSWKKLGGTIWQHILSAR